MKNSLTRFREAGSFVAGILIGLSITVAVFAMMVVNPGGWQMSWVFGAPILLGLGLTLFVALAKPGHRRMTGS
jgi:hypothetical protein